MLFYLRIIFKAIYSEIIRINTGGQPLMGTTPPRVSKGTILNLLEYVPPKGLYQGNTYPTKAVRKVKRNTTTPVSQLWILPIEYSNPFRSGNYGVNRGTWFCQLWTLHRYRFWLSLRRPVVQWRYLSSNRAWILYLHRYTLPRFKMLQDNV